MGHLFGRHTIESDEKHVRRGVVDAEQIGMRWAGMIAVIIAINRDGPAACAASDASFMKDLCPDQFAFRGIPTAERLAIASRRILTTAR